MYCNDCAHRGQKAGECTFGGICIIRNLNLHREPYATAEVKVTVQQESPKATETVFNPFQRGNGCLLSGYSREEIFGRSR